MLIPTPMIICWSLFIIEVEHSIEDPFNVHMTYADVY
jgi:uncharacterized protein Veg